MSEVDKWIELTRECNYLPENDLKVYRKINFHFLKNIFKAVITLLIFLAGESSLIMLLIYHSLNPKYFNIL